MYKLKPEPVTPSKSHCKVGKITHANRIKPEEKDKTVMDVNNKDAKYPIVDYIEKQLGFMT